MKLKSFKFSIERIRQKVVVLGSNIKIPTFCLSSFNFFRLFSSSLFLWRKFKDLDFTTGLSIFFLKIDSFQFIHFSKFYFQKTYGTLIVFIVSIVVIGGVNGSLFVYSAFFDGNLTGTIFFSRLLNAATWKLID